jgi:hypothetical protein
MEAKDAQTRHQTLSRWMGATVVVTYLKRTGAIDACEKNPSFPLARAILLDVTLGEHMIPKEKREALA